MNNNNNSEKDLYKNRLVLTIVLSAVLLLLGLFLIFHDKITDFSGGKTTEDDTALDLSNLDPSPDIRNVYYETNTDEPLRSLTQIESFSCNVSLTDSLYTSSYYNCSLTVSGDKFRIESDTKTEIYDGENLYISSPAYTVRAVEGEYDCFSEIGIVSLDSLRERAYAGNAGISLTSDGMNADVLFYDESSDKAEKYTVSLLYGIVVSGEITEKNQIVRSFTLSDISMIDRNSDIEELFRIPE